MFDKSTSDLMEVFNEQDSANFKTFYSVACSVRKLFPSKIKSRSGYTGPTNITHTVNTTPIALAVVGSANSNDRTARQ